MLVGVPIAVVMMIVAWFLLTQVFFRPEVKRIPGGRKLVEDELAKLGPMSRPEWMVLTVFVLAALSWILIPTIFDPAPISDAGIAMTVGLLLFILPAGAERGVRLLDWDTAVDMPWGVLLLFGGGLALSGQFTSSGLTESIGNAVEGFSGIPIIVLVAVLAFAILFLTEITSNTATAATFIPVVGGVALGIGADPLILTVPVALCCHLRVHAAGRHPAQRRGVRIRLRDHRTDGEGRVRDQHDLPRRHHSGDNDARSRGLRHRVL